MSVALDSGQRLYQAYQILYSRVSIVQHYASSRCSTRVIWQICIGSYKFVRVNKDTKLEENNSYHFEKDRNTIFFPFLFFFLNVLVPRLIGCWLTLIDDLGSCKIKCCSAVLSLTQTVHDCVLRTRPCTAPSSRVTGLFLQTTWQEMAWFFRRNLPNQ